MEYSKNRTILLARMDKAFGQYSFEAEKLSVLLGETRDPSSWTSITTCLSNESRRSLLTSNTEKFKMSYLR